MWDYGMLMSSKGMVPCIILMVTSMTEIGKLTNVMAKENTLTREVPIMMDSGKTI